MRLLAVLIVSLEKLFRQRIIWLVIPVVSLVSILVYHKATAGFNPQSYAEENTYAAIQSLKAELKESNQTQLEEIASLKHQLEMVDAQTQTLGAATSLERAAETTPTSPSTNSNLKLLSTTKDAKNITLYEKPSVQAEKIKTLKSDTIYFYRQKANGWYEIELENEPGGWIQEEFVLEMP